MEDIAAEIVSSHEPSSGWRNIESEQRLMEVVLAMLEEMDLDTVDESFTTIVSVIQAEYGE